MQGVFAVLLATGTEGWDLFQLVLTTTENVVGLDTTTSSGFYCIPSARAPAKVRILGEPFSCSFQGG